MLPLLLSSGAPTAENPPAGARSPLEPAERRRLQEWLVRLADGDRTAFEPLFAALWPLLSRFTARLLPSPADAEDAAQQALLKLFARASAFDRERDALAWAMGIAAWECRTARQRAARRREEPLGAAAAAAGPSAEEAVVERDLLDAVRELLGTLRPEESEAILAAAQGRRPPGAAFRKRLERARRRLREAWRIKHGTE
ncbi:MAG TPA: sigma factor [Thermoanaerobaculia bacterium]|nr:sigma factor [Thermoanaerobaculia bacterium]